MYASVEKNFRIRIFWKSCYTCARTGYLARFGDSRGKPYTEQIGINDLKILVSDLKCSRDVQEF